MSHTSDGVHGAIHTPPSDEAVDASASSAETAIGEFRGTSQVERAACSKLNLDELDLTVTLNWDQCVAQKGELPGAPKLDIAVQQHDGPFLPAALGWRQVNLGWQESHHPSYPCCALALRVALCLFDPHSTTRNTRHGNATAHARTLLPP